MARRRQSEGQLQFEDFEPFEPVSRMPKMRLPRASAQKKLETPYVFTQQEAALPRPWVDLAGASSRVSRLRYDEGLSQIHVEFVDGTPWVYEDVPPSVYETFVTSDSKGRFIHQVLDQYPYRRASSAETASW